MKFDMYDLETGSYHYIPATTCKYRTKSPRGNYKQAITSWSKSGWAHVHTLGIL